MIRHLLPIVILLLCWSLCVPARAAELTEVAQNPPAPPLQLRDLRDRPHTLAEYRGKVVLVNFWASWCPPCIYEMPGLERLKQRLADQPFEILAVNTGEKKYKVWKFVKLIEFDLPVLLDTSSEAFDAWGVTVMPTTFLLDASGRIRYRITGDPGWGDADTIAVVEKLLAETKREPPAHSLGSDKRIDRPGGTVSTITVPP